MFDDRESRHRFMFSDKPAFGSETRLDENRFSDDKLLKPKELFFT